MLTIREAAARVGVTPKTIRAWIAAGRLALARDTRPRMVSAGAVQAAARAARARGSRRRASSGARGQRAYEKRAAGLGWDLVAIEGGFRDGSGAYRAAARWGAWQHKPWPPTKS